MSSDWKPSDNDDVLTPGIWDADMNITPAPASIEDSRKRIRAEAKVLAKQKSWTFDQALAFLTAKAQKDKAGMRQRAGALSNLNAAAEQAAAQATQREFGILPVEPIKPGLMDVVMEKYADAARLTYARSPFVFNVSDLQKAYNEAQSDRADLQFGWFGTVNGQPGEVFFSRPSAEGAKPAPEPEEKLSKNGRCIRLEEE